MRKYYLTITSILVLVIGIASCANEENKTQNNTASRPTIPIMANEVQIGNQIWMTKNLNVSRYRNGDPIPQVTDPSQWASLTTGAWCYYENDLNYGKIYGKLYNWYAVNDPRGLAPVGWHVPSAAEWGTLQNYLGGEAVAGGKMREVGTIHWLSGDFASNSSGFTALPGGYRLGNFDDIGGHGYWWSTTTDSHITINAFIRDIETNSNSLGFNSGYKEACYSVRCIKD